MNMSPSQFQVLIKVWRGATLFFSGVEEPALRLLWCHLTSGKHCSEPRHLGTEQQGCAGVCGSSDQGFARYRNFMRVSLLTFADNIIALLIYTRNPSSLSISCVIFTRGLWGSLLVGKEILTLVNLHTKFACWSAVLMSTWMVPF